MMTDLALEQSYIRTKKAYFKELFEKDADENINEFLQYLTEQTNRSQVNAIEDLSKEVKSFKDNIEERE